MPLISFLDVSYSVSFAFRGSGYIEDDDLWYHHKEIFSFFQNQLRGSCSAGIQLDEPWSQLGGLRDSGDGLRAS